MKILDIRGGYISVNPNQYLIDWDKEISKHQKKVSDFLRTFWQKDLVLCEFRIPGSLLRVDLMNVTKKIIVETSPDEIHKNYNPFMHKNRANFLKKLKADNQKMDWAEKAGYTYIELDSNEIKNLSAETFAKFGISL